MKCTQGSKAVAVFLLAALVACSGGDGGSNGGGGVGGAPPPGEVSLDRSSGPAASVVRIDGLNLEHCPLDTSEIRVGGQTAPAVLNARKETLMRLPLFYDEGTRWAAPPSEPQDVEVFCKGELWTTLEAAVTVTELAPAPGTTAALIEDYQQIVADYKALAEALAPNPGIQQQVFVALFAGLDDTVTGTGPHSLPPMLAELEASEPQALALMDAIFAVGGADEAVRALRELVRELRATTPTFEGQQAAPITLDGFGPKDALFSIDEPLRLLDTELSKSLSIYESLRLFSKEFIGETSEEFGMASGLLTIVVKSKLAKVLSTTLSLLDYMLNKVVVSSLPATLDKIELNLHDTTLDNSETTSATFWLHASNSPVELKITELTGLINTGLGFAGPGGASGGQALSWIKGWDDIVGDYFMYLFDLATKAFTKYGMENEEGHLFDMELFSIIPEIEFYALGSTRELYLLWPDASKVVHPLEEELQWRADDEYWGSTWLSVTPTAESFGEHGDTRSNEVQVQVGELAVLIDPKRMRVLEGESDVFRVKLSNAPNDTRTVFVQHDTGDPDITVPPQFQLTFDDSNWDEYQAVPISAAQDEDQEDGQAIVIAGTVVDPDTPIESIGELTAIETDDDRPYFVVEPASVRIPEGTTAEVGVRLSHEPSSALTAVVEYASGDPDITVRSPIRMRFTPGDWDSNQIVTLHAETDDDEAEDKTQFRVSANPPAQIDETYITAFEDEAGATIEFQYESWNQAQRFVMRGTIYVQLAPLNFDLPLRETAELSAHFTSDYTDPASGVGAVTIINHPMEPACPCGPPACYERQNPEDTLLYVDGRVVLRGIGLTGSSDYDFTMTLPFLNGDYANVRCTEGGGASGIHYTARLIP